MTEHLPDHLNEEATEEIRKVTDFMLERQEKIDRAREDFNEYLKHIEEKFGIPKKVMRNVVKLKMKQAKKDFEEETDMVSSVYESLYSD